MITVLLPVYNGQKYVGYSIRSILRQSFEKFELLIVDDGSTDNTEKIIKSITDVRINYYKIEHSGLSAALNFGLQHARYDIIARMDADDLSLLQRLQLEYDYFVTQPENTILSCRYALFAGKKIIGVVNSPTDHESIKKRLLLHNEFTHSGIMYNKKFILENGGYRNVPFEDFELWLRLRNKARFTILPEVLSLVRLDYLSLARENIVKQYALIYHLLEEFYAGEDIFREFGIAGTQEEMIIRGWREYFFWGQGPRAVLLAEVSVKSSRQS